MSDKHLIFVHGRGSGATRNRKWLDGLINSLERSGFRFEPSDLEAIKCSPRYSIFLDERVEIPDDFPPLEGREQPVAAAGRDRERYFERQQDLQELLCEGYPHDRAAKTVRALAGNDSLAEQVIGSRFKDVKRYCEERDRRHRILTEILGQLPSSGRCILIGHSLGSIVALDLLPYWPAELRIDLLVTCGSPAALGPIRRQLEGRRQPFPYDLVSGWVNVYDANDPVTGGSGLAPYFNHGVDASGTTATGASPATLGAPQRVIDHQVENGGYGANHDIDRYLDHVLIGNLLGRCLRKYISHHDPKPRILASDEAERGLWLDVSLAQQFRTELQQRTTDIRKRARMCVAAEHARVASVRALNLPQATRLEDQLDELIGKMKPDPSQQRKLLIQLRATPPFQPFEIDPESSTVLPSLVVMAEGLGATANDAKHADDAVTEAQAAQKKGSTWPAVAVGGAALVMAAVATGGVALMAAPTLAGAAATTSGLAAIGSLVGGGMTTGLFVTAGTGAASSALTVAAASMLSPAQFQAEVVKIHAEALICCWEGELRRARGLRDQLRSVRDEAERGAREHAHVDGRGDKSEATKAYRAKSDSVKLALAHLRAKDCP